MSMQPGKKYRLVDDHCKNRYLTMSLNHGLLNRFYDDGYLIDDEDECGYYINGWLVIDIHEAHLFEEVV